jgi:hypothetical protein
VSETNARAIWQGFCQRFDVLKDAVPLFEAGSQGCVRTRLVGRGVTQRHVLARSTAMEAMIRGQTQLLIEDRTSERPQLDGLIYCMGRKHGGEFIPLYIGKAETNGKQGSNLSANLARLTTDTSKFARWGDNYAYHIGDLSACVLPGHAAGKMTDKYRQWAQVLFVECPSPEPRLRQPVYFWARAWNRSDVGVWQDLGPTRLTFLEYLLIGVASIAYSGLLNREGVPRG